MAFFPFQVRRRGDHQKHEARVICIGLDCDLAMLQVDDPDFWDGGSFASYSKIFARCGKHARANSMLRASASSWGAEKRANRL